MIPVTRFRHALLISITAMALSHCASSKWSSTIARQPAGLEVTIAQISSLYTFRAASEIRVPMEFRLNITNGGSYPVTLTSVELETVGVSGAYAITRVRHQFERKIGAHAAEVIPFRAWVQALEETDTGRVVSPVIVRGIARFDSVGRAMQFTFTGRFQQ